jgi:hypothetical protein
MGNSFEVVGPKGNFTTAPRGFVCPKLTVSYTIKEWEYEHFHKNTAKVKPGTNNLHKKIPNNKFWIGLFDVSAVRVPLSSRNLIRDGELQFRGTLEFDREILQDGHSYCFQLRSGAIKKFSSLCATSSTFRVTISAAPEPQPLHVRSSSPGLNDSVEEAAGQDAAAGIASSTAGFPSSSLPFGTEVQAEFRTLARLNIKGLLEKYQAFESDQESSGFAFKLGLQTYFTCRNSRT